MNYFAAPSFACMLCGKVHTSPSVSYLLPEDTQLWECAFVGPSCVKPMAMSDGLYQFLSDWLHWAETGEALEDGQSYDKTDGLCYNADIYCEKVNGDADSLYCELLDLFIADGLNDAYPFGKELYNIRSEAGTMHKCELRLSWVRRKLAAHKAAIDRTTA